MNIKIFIHQNDDKTFEVAAYGQSLYEGFFVAVVNDHYHLRNLVRMLSVGNNVELRSSDSILKALADTQ